MDEVMAEETEKHQSDNSDGYRLDEDSALPVVYANFTHVVMGPSDISITLGNKFETGEESILKRDIRVVMTHEHFLKMMVFWGKYYSFIYEAYGGKPESLIDIRNKNPERFSALLSEHFGDDLVPVEGK